MLPTNIKNIAQEALDWVMLRLKKKMKKKQKNFVETKIF